jgi:hypothetical protein
VTVRLRLRQLVVLALLLACVLAGAGIYWFRARRATGHSELVAYLPAVNASLIYVDVDALRRSGILSVVTGPKTAEEPDYRQFVAETNFDYRQDLDALAVALKDGKTYFALRGRFSWDHLRDYAVRQGGSCHNNFCVLSGSQPNRRISFYLLKKNILAMAVGPDDFGAYQVSDQVSNVVFSPPRNPVWALIPATTLQQMSSLPEAARAFVPALRDAQQIVFSIDATSAQQLELGVHVACKDETAAAMLLTQLEGITKTLRELLARQHQKPDAGDFSAVLVAGAFRREQQQVFGVWPLPRAFVDAIAGTAY